MLNDLGIGLVQLDRPAEAVPLHERALAIYEQSDGPEHLTTATTLVYLCEALLHADQPARAPRPARVSPRAPVTLPLLVVDQV